MPVLHFRITSADENIDITKPIDYDMIAKA